MILFDFNKLTKYFRPFQPTDKSISVSAIIGEGTLIQPNCFMETMLKLVQIASSIPM
jgi:UDP-3-O-[3-hydroxymyristoyl] glucosamine N-acyltransferase